MNPQQRGPGQRGIEWTHVFGYGSGYTWNPVGGCKHGCEWHMPDGTKTICYAESTVNSMQIPGYDHGFKHHYWHPEKLTEPLRLKKPAGIFMGSMADPMGHWVGDEQINQMLEICQQTRQHIYFLLTKNAPRLKSFTFPPNVWVGVSAPPSAMFGRTLNNFQQHRMLKVALESLAQVDVPVRWLSAEPLSFNVASMVQEANLQWVVVGAASKGSRFYQPAPGHVEDLLAICDKRKIPVFFKGNLTWQPHREHFPPLTPPQPKAVPMVQESLF
jgi:protein gp37